MPRLHNSFMTAFNNDENTPSFSDRWLSNLYLSILDQSTLEANNKSEANEVPSAEELAAIFSKEKWGWKWSYKWLTVPATAIIEVLTNSLAEITLSANIGLDTWKRNKLQKLDQKSWAAVGVKVAHGFAKAFAIGFHAITSSLSFTGHFFNRMTNNFSKNPATATFTTVLGTIASIAVGGTIGLAALLSNPIGWAIILIGGPLALAALASKMYTDYQEIKNDRDLILSEKKQDAILDKEETDKVTKVVRQAHKILVIESDIVDDLIGSINANLELQILKSPAINFEVIQIFTQAELERADAEPFAASLYETAWKAIDLKASQAAQYRSDTQIQTALDRVTITPKVIAAQTKLLEVFYKIQELMHKQYEKALSDSDIKMSYYIARDDLEHDYKISDEVAIALWDKYSVYIIKKYKEAAAQHATSRPAVNNASTNAALDIETTKKNVATFLSAMLADYNKNPVIFNFKEHKDKFLQAAEVNAIPGAANNPQLKEMIWNRIIIVEFDKAIDEKLKKSQDALDARKNDDTDTASSHSSETLTGAVDTAAAEIAATEKAAIEAAAKVAKIISQALPAQSAEETEETQKTTSGLLTLWQGSQTVALRPTAEYLRPTVSVK